MELVQPQVVKFNSNTDLPDIVIALTEKSGII